MTYEDLLSDIDSEQFRNSRTLATPYAALRAVLELHKPLPIVNGDGAANCCWCQIAEIRDTPYPCPTIQAIEKELA